MKKILIAFIFGMFLVSFVSAGISFGIQPHVVYNFGDKINTTIKIIPSGEFEGIISVSLKCGSKSVEVYKEFLSLTSEIEKELVVPLVKPLVGNLTGNCNLNILEGGEKKASSDSFKISKFISVEFSKWGEFFNPGEKIKIEGSAVKENGENVEGDYWAKIGEDVFNGEVNQGSFSIIFNIPNNFSSGEHKIELNVSEKDKNGEIINFGRKLSFLNIRQVPTSVEIILNKKEFLPGESVKGKVILHDQTGKSISDAEVYVAVKNNAREIVKKIITKTEREFSYATAKDESPGNFVISAYSQNLINSADAKIVENKKIDSEIINKTLILTNVGNVFYNDTLALKIGDDDVKIPVSLPVGASEIYSLSAPDGEYDVVVGNLKKRVLLSGNAVQVKKVDQGISQFISFIWVFVLIFLALGIYFIFRRGHKPHIFAKIKKVKQAERKLVKDKKTENIFDLKKKVEISLSIVGTKQNAVVGCLSLKNYEEIRSGKGNVKETFSKISDLIEKSKGIIYLVNEHIFFILAPSFTKTFKNQKSGILLSQDIQSVLNEHNKKFKQKIDFGMSLNYGTVIIKVEPVSIKFMSLGTLIASCKKLSNYSNGEILISDKFKESTDEKIKGDLIEVGNLKAYKLEKLIDKNIHSTFLEGFLARQEKEKSKESGKNKS